MLRFLPCSITILAAQYALASETAQTTKRADSFDDVLDWVDPLIGSQGGGNVFAGATLPYGMAKGEQGRTASREERLLSCFVVDSCEIIFPWSDMSFA